MGQVQYDKHGLGAADRRRRLFTLLVHSQTLVCAPDWKFKHATRILDVIMLPYPVQKVRPMPGMWIQSIPVIAIPWGRMNTGQRGALLSSIQEG